MKWMLELVWWLTTLILVIGVMLPIYNGMPAYPFWTPNIIFIVVFITAIRHIFLLKHSLIPRKAVFKITIIILCLPIIAYIIQYMNNFMYFLDNLTVADWDKYFGAIEHAQQMKLRDYVRTEMIFFGTSAIICCIILPVRLIVSIWRTHNLGTV